MIKLNSKTNYHDLLGLTIDNLDIAELYLKSSYNIEQKDNAIKQAYSIANNCDNNDIVYLFNFENRTWEIIVGTNEASKYFNKEYITCEIAII